MKRQLISVSELVEVARWGDLLGEVPMAKDLRDHLHETLGGAWSQRRWKAPSSGGGGHKEAKSRVLGNHMSTFRVICQVKIRT